MAFGLHTTEGGEATANPRVYAEKWQEQMRQAYQVASRNITKSAARGKKHYDKKAGSSLLKPGDRVLDRNVVPPGGPGKLQSYWQDAVHQVVAQKDYACLRSEAGE